MPLAPIDQQAYWNLVQARLSDATAAVVTAYQFTAISNQPGTNQVSAKLSDLYDQLQALSAVIAVHVP